MTPEEMEAKLATLETSNTEMKAKVEGQETLLQQHKTEMGEARKGIETSLAEAKQLGQDTETQKKMLDRLDAIEQNPRIKTKPDGDEGRAGDKKTIKELKESCSPEQKKAADAIFFELKPEQRVALLNDDEAFGRFIAAAQEAVPSVPTSIFGDEEIGDSGKKNEFRQLFNLADEESSHVPGAGNRRGSSGYANASRSGGGKNPQVSRRLPGGIIPAPSQQNK